ncbi:hypothetical protein [Chryseobacterium gossypii]|uniref:hypothetical protein n=1 Tax=Chryseobacterium gossypii TaxID=3231602 RepID=UPI0035242E3B
MKKLVLFLAIFFLFTCNKITDQKKETKKEEKHELKNILEEENLKTQEYIPYKDDKFDFNDKKLYENLKKAINEGDTLAYNIAAKQYIINGRQKEFLYYAILMAEKNNYIQAYSDISTILGIYNYENPSDMEFVSKYKLYCLLKAYEMGDDGAKQSVNYIYTEKGKKIPKSSSIYCPKNTK